MADATITSTPREWTLTGITAGAGQCDCCTRRVTQRVFQVAHPDHGAAHLGRRCAAKATGYPTTAVERMAARAVRRAEITRRRVTVAAEYPDLAADWADFEALCRARRAEGYDPSQIRQPVGALLFQEATIEDSWWGGRGRTAYPDYHAYIAANR